MTTATISTTITGVHPYADKFPMLPDSELQVVGSNLRRLHFVRIRESQEHKGYFDITASNGMSSASTDRPMSGSPTGRELMAKFIHVELGNTSLEWRTETAEPRSAIDPVTKTGEPHVYFISDEDGYIKIGTARDVHSRLSTLQTASRQKLTLIGAVKGDHADESRYHDIFSADRVRGEWFSPSTKLSHFIKEVCK